MKQYVLFRFYHIRTNVSIYAEEKESFHIICLLTIKEKATVLFRKQYRCLLLCNQLSKLKMPYISQIPTYSVYLTSHESNPYRREDLP